MNFAQIPAAGLTIDEVRAVVQLCFWLMERIGDAVCILWTAGLFIVLAGAVRSAIFRITNQQGDPHEL